jgi:DNA-binding response OmpR family regulator
VRRPAAPHLLLVSGAQHDYTTALLGAGYRVTTVDTVREALASRSRPDALILEMVIPDGDLSHLADAMRSGRRTRAMTVIALAGEAHQDAVVQCGATFCRHPCPPDELVALVRQTLALKPPALTSGGVPQRSKRPV